MVYLRYSSYKNIYFDCISTEINWMKHHENVTANDYRNIVIITINITNCTLLNNRQQSFQSTKILDFLFVDHWWYVTVLSSHHHCRYRCHHTSRTQYILSIVGIIYTYKICGIKIVNRYNKINLRLYYCRNKDFIIKPLCIHPNKYKIKLK